MLSWETPITTVIRRPRPPASPDKDLPPLHPGDRLDRATFHARYEAMPHGTRAELVGGLVYMPSPVYQPHGRMYSRVMSWLGYYEEETPGVELYDNTIVFLSDYGEPQPDAALIIEPGRGGQARQEQNCLAGAPELVVEIAYSSEAYDLHAKKADYERAGVREYVAVVLREPRVVWFALEEGHFQEQSPGEDGLYRSKVFPGLWLDPAALLRRAAKAVRAALERGLATSEHAAFVDRLALAAGG